MERILCSSLTIDAPTWVFGSFERIAESIATVTVHIKKIREKIEMNTNKPQYIETIWGVGYRLKL